jgi:hypothetical protein
VVCPSGDQNVAVASQIHCSEGRTKTVRQSVQKYTVSARAPSEPLDFNKIGEDDDFTVITSKKKQT